MNRALRRRRGEGYVEYIVIVSMIMVCSVVGLFNAGTAGLREAVRKLAGMCANCDSELDEGELPDPNSTGGGEDGSGSGEGDGTAGSSGSGSGSNDSFWSMLSSWFGSSYLASFMGLFGWFGLL